MSALKIIFNLCNCDVNNLTGSNQYLFNQYPHVQKEYLNHIKRCNKQHKNIMGSYQFIPEDFYAIYLFKNIDENSISTDYPETYIVNLYCANSPKGNVMFDLNVVKQQIISILNKVYRIFNNDISLKIETLFDKTYLDLYLSIARQIEKTLLNQYGFKKDGSLKQYLDQGVFLDMRSFSLWEPVDGNHTVKSSQ